MPCYKSAFPPPPELVSPSCTTNQTEIDDFNARAESVWNWLLTVMKDDETDPKTFKHFINELNSHCNIPTDYDSSTIYNRGDTVYHNGYLWRSNIDNNTDEPTLGDECDGDKWSIIVDDQKFLEVGGRTVQVSTSQELIDALECIDYHQFIDPYTIELQAGTYTISSTITITRAGSLGNWIKLKGIGGVTIENGTASDFMLFLRDKTVMSAEGIEFKGNGGNNGIDLSNGSIFFSPTSTNTFRGFDVALRPRFSSYVEVANSIFRDCQKGVLAQNNSYASCAGIDYQTTPTSGGDSVALMVEYNSVGNCANATIDGSTHGILARNASSINAWKADIKNNEINGVWADYGSAINADSVKVDGQNRCVHGLHATNGSNIYAGTPQNEVKNVVKGVVAESSSTINFEGASVQATGTGLLVTNASFISANGCILDCLGGFKVYLSVSASIHCRNATFNVGGDCGLATGNCFVDLTNTTGDGKLTLENWGYGLLYSTSFTSNLSDNTVTVDGVARR
jgi:hypothetical protein